MKKRLVACRGCAPCRPSGLSVDRTEPHKRPDGQRSLITESVISEDPVEAALETLRKSRKILATRNVQPQVPLTVGDLSFAAAEKCRNREGDAMFELRNVKEGLTVGDLSGREKDQRGLDQLYQGPAVPQPLTSESQEALMEMQWERRKKAEEIFDIKQFIFEQQQEEETMRENAQQDLEQKLNERIHKA